MVNWCTTAYVIEGNAKELESLYKAMTEVKMGKNPNVEDPFGSVGLLCLVKSLNGDRSKMDCRGYWKNLEINGDTLKVTTLTAWKPSNKILDFICEKFPSLGYYYRAEESGKLIYETNDRNGKYFPEKYRVEIFTPEEVLHTKYFTELSAVYGWLEEQSGQPVKSEAEFETLLAQWRKECAYAYGYIDEFKIVP